MGRFDLKEIGGAQQVFRKVSTLGLHVGFCYFKSCCFVMRGGLPWC